jgi:3',5'-cyclic AMP phosphodiesterase CpdA
MRTHRSFLTVVTLTAVLAAGLAAQELTVPNKPTGTLKFAVIGDSGTGDSNQYRLAKVFTDMHQRFPYEFVLMMGDNMYGSENARDFQRKFEIPYKPVLDKGVKFYASLGNHDSTNQRMYKLFNMNGERFYTFRPKSGVRFFALDSNYMDRTQLQWLEKELAASGSDWKIMYFHHPIYSSGGRHGSDTALRDQLEPLFVKYGVDVVMAGHEHFYERLKPQKGIHYFISGGAGKLRRGDVGGEFTEKAFDQGFHFMILEIDGEQMHFQVVTDQGKTVDSGVITRRKVDNQAAPSQPAAPPVKPVPPQDKPTAKPSNPPAKPSNPTTTKPSNPPAKPATP